MVLSVSGCGGQDGAAESGLRFALSVWGGKCKENERKFNGSGCEGQDGAAESGLRFALSMGRKM